MGASVLGQVFTTSLTGATFAALQVNQQQSTEGPGQLTFGVAGTVGPGTSMSADATTGTRTQTSRKNGANGNIVITATSGVAGVYSDNTHSDSVVAGDRYTFQNSAVSYGMPWLAAKFTASSNHAYISRVANPLIAGAVSTTRFFPLSGYGTSSGSGPSQAASQLTVRQPATFQYFTINVTSNTWTTPVSAGIQKGGVAGNNIVSIGSTTTGVFSDTTHTDSLANGDLVNGYTTTSGTGTGAAQAAWSSGTFVNTSGNNSNDVIWGNDASAFASGGTQYTAMIYTGPGSSAFNSTETTQQYQHGFDVLIKNWRQFVTVNATTATSTGTSRVNGANGNQTLSIGSAATGLFEDTTNSDSILATDNYNFQYVIGSAANFRLGCGALLEGAPAATFDMGSRFVGVFP